MVHRHGHGHVDYGDAGGPQVNWDRSSLTIYGRDIDQYLVVHIWPKQDAGKLLFFKFLSMETNKDTFQNESAPC